MDSNLNLKFRKNTQGKESEFVNEFITEYTNLLENQDLEYTILTETYAEIGVPDIIIAFWDRKDIKWNPNRNKLTRTDIKILHHISNRGKRLIKKSTLKKDLGFSDRILSKSLDNILLSNLISIENDKIRLNSDEKIFFVKKIISIEAKINDWKTAFLQAKLNENFSSHSYILMPEEKISNIPNHNVGNIGIISYNGKNTKFKKRAKKSRLPGSYFSWIINEHIGRTNLIDNLNV